MNPTAFVRRCELWHLRHGLEIRTPASDPFAGYMERALIKTDWPAGRVPR